MIGALTYLEALLGAAVIALTTLFSLIDRLRCRTIVKLLTELDDCKTALREKTHEAEMWERSRERGWEAREMVLVDLNAALARNGELVAERDQLRAKLATAVFRDPKTGRIVKAAK